MQPSTQNATRPSRQASHAVADQTVIEVVTFKLVAGISDADYVKASRATEDFVRGLPGFRHRMLSKAEDGTWTDTVVWADMASAKSAAEKFPQAECTTAMMQMIDPVSVSLRHDLQLWSMTA